MAKREIDKLGLGKEFDNWVKQMQSIPTTWEDIKIGDKFNLVNHKYFMGCKGIVTKKERDKLWFNCIYPNKDTEELWIGINEYEDHIEFL